MDNKKEIVQAIEECWRPSDPHFLICKALVDYFEKTDARELRHLSQASVYRIVGSRFSPDLIIESVQFLAGSYINLIDIGFELIDENDDIFELDKSDIANARRTGTLAHPNTGLPVENYEEKVFLYYQPTLTGLRALKHEY